MADLVSVVMPVYNGAVQIGEALEALLTQTYSPIEVIVVDDGSTDGTVELVRTYPEVRLIQQANAGPAVARNNGVEHSQGQYISFVDHDDVWLPEKVQRQVDLLQANGGGFATCHVRYVLEVAPPSWFRGPADGTPVIGWVPSCWLMDRATWDKVGPFEPSFGHGCDTDWLARARNLHVATLVAEECLVNYRVHAENESGKGATTMQSLTSVLRAQVQRKRGAGA